MGGVIRKRSQHVYGDCVRKCLPLNSSGLEKLQGGGVGGGRREVDGKVGSLLAAHGSRRDAGGAVMGNRGDCTRYSKRDTVRL